MARIECTNPQCSKSYHLTQKGMEKAHKQINGKVIKQKGADSTINDIKNDFSPIQKSFDVVNLINNMRVATDDAYSLSQDLNETCGEERFSTIKERDNLVDYKTNAILYDKKEDKFYFVEGSSDSWGWSDDEVEYHSVKEVQKYKANIPEFKKSDIQLDDVKSQELQDAINMIKELYTEIKEDEKTRTWDMFPIDSEFETRDIIKKLEENENIRKHEVYPEDDERESDVIATSVYNSGNGQYQNARSVYGAYILEDTSTGEAITIPYNYQSEYGTSYEIYIDGENNLEGIDVLEYSGDVVEDRFK